MRIQVHLPYLLLMLLNFTLLPLLIRNTGMAMVMMLVGTVSYTHLTLPTKA